MNKLVLILSLLLLQQSLVNASMNKQVQDANSYYYKQLENIAIMKDKSQSCYARELAFRNFLVGLDGSAYTTYNKGLIEVLIEDPDFIFRQFYHHPHAYKKWVDNFNFTWYRTDQKSRYPELKSLAIKSLEEDIKKSTELLKMKKELLKKIKKTQPRVIE